MKFGVGLLALVSILVGVPAFAQVGGSGTATRVPVWSDDHTLANSTITQTGSRMGVRVTSPTATLDVLGPNGSSTTPTALPVLNVVGGIGAGGVGGSGSRLQLMSGAGGNVSTFGVGGTGAALTIEGGTNATFIPASTRGIFTGGNGGSITIQPGRGGFGSNGSGHSGNLLLAPAVGRVGIRTGSPSATFEVGAGGTTLADSWAIRSSRRNKTDIQPLTGALEKIGRLQGVSYKRQSDGRHEIGLVAEDVESVVPEVVSREAGTHQVQGVDYAKLTALLIEAIKTQQEEIVQLQRKLDEVLLRK